MNNVKLIAKKTEGDKLLKNLAISSICLYIIVSTIFDSMKTELSRISSVAIYICLACCAFYIISRGTFKLGQLEIWLIVFEIALGVSALYTPNFNSIVSMYFYRCYTSAILVLLISNTVSTRKDFSILVDAYIVAGVIFSIYIYFTYGFANLAESSSRMDNLFGNQNGTGMSCAFPICFAVYRLVTAKTKLRFLYIPAMLICIPAVMFTGSRKALLIALFAIIVFSLVYSNSKMLIVKIMWIIIIALIAFCVIYYVPAFHIIRDRMLATFEFFGGEASVETGRSDATRINYLIKSLREFLKSPIYGNGFYYSYQIYNTYSHCNFTELLMNGGIITFSIFYYIHVAIMRKAKRLMKNVEGRDYGAFLIMLMAAFMVVDIGVVSYYDRYTLIMFTLCFCDENIQKPIASVQNNT